MDLNLARIFVKVVQNSSFSKAAEILRLSNSAVSKAVSKLERESGAKLLLRTTRSLTLTQMGKSYYEASLAPVTLLEDAMKTLSGTGNSMAGVLKMTAPEDIANHIVAPVVAELSRKHPQLKFDIEVGNEIVDLVKDGFDLAIRAGIIKDSSLKIKRVGEISLITVAAPSYLKNSKRIKHPRDLLAHECLALNYEGLSRPWSFKSATERYRLETKAKIMANQMTSLLAVTCAGAGVAIVPSYICANQLRAGSLSQVLTEWSLPPVPLSLVTPLAPSSSLRLKALVEGLTTQIQIALDS